jgi:hypothetical protein
MNPIRPITPLILAAGLLLAIACDASTGDTIGPPRLVAKVTVTPSSANLTAGETLQLTEKIEDAAGNALKRTLTWVSGNPAVATVSGTGLVTGVSAGGPVTITATTEGKTGTAVVTVAKPTPVKLVVITPPALGTFDYRDTIRLSAVARDGEGNRIPNAVIKWSTSNPQGFLFVTHETSGVNLSDTATGSAVLLYPVFDGSALIQARAGTASDTVTISVHQEVASVTITPKSIVVDSGREARFYASALDSHGTPAVYAEILLSSRDSSIAVPFADTDPSSGSPYLWVVGGRPGVTTIIATVAGTPDTASVQVTVSGGP